MCCIVTVLAILSAYLFLKLDDVNTRNTKKIDKLEKEFDEHMGARRYK